MTPDTAAAVTVVVTVTYPRGMYGDDIRAVVHDILAEALIGDGVEVTVR